MEHECTYDLSAVDDELRCGECGGKPSFALTETFRRRCSECGERFMSADPVGQVCEPCLDDLGFHEVNLEE